MKLIGIVAVDRNWAIGKRGGLLYDLPQDMKHFRETTSHHIVVCGYNTLMSFPGSRPLTNRITICIAHEGVQRDDCTIVHTVKGCLELLNRLPTSENMEIFIIGGGMVYKSFLPYYDSVIVTLVDAEDDEATVFFPNLDELPEFKIINKTEPIFDGKYKTNYITYERVS